MNSEKIKNWIYKTLSSNCFLFITISLLVFALYYHTLFFDFVALDDYDLIVNKKHLLSDIKNLPLLFKTDLFMSESGIYYRPVVLLSFMVDNLVGGNNPLFYHLSNIIFHIIGSCLLYVLLNQFTGKKYPSFLFTLLFAIHPALVQSVVWIPGRNDILLFIFLSITLISIKKIETASSFKRIFFILISVISFLLALLTKENAILMLFFILFYLIFLSVKKFSLREIILILFPYLLASIIYLILRQSADTSFPSNKTIFLTFFDYIKGLLNYLGKIFFPINLSVLTLPENINIVYGILSIIVFTIISLKGVKNIIVFSFGILWFFLFLLSGFIGVAGFANFLDHRLYVPFGGLAISLINLKIFDQLKKIFLIPIFFIYFLSFIYLNYNHTFNFRDPFSFYKSAVETAPNSFFAHRGMANVYHRMMNFDLAENHYRISLELNPKSIETYVNFALNFNRKNTLDSAEYYLIEALKIYPNNPVVMNNLGNLYLKKGLINKAESYLRKAIQNNQYYFEAYNNLGVVYARQKIDSLAYKNFRKSIEINPFFAEGYFNLALFFFNKNNLDSSFYFYKKAIENGFPENNPLKDKF